MLLPSDPAHPFFFPQDAMAEIGAAHSTAYAEAAPFPMIVFDDFVNPLMLDTCLAHFPEAPEADTAHFDNDRERAKWGYSPERLHPDVRTIFYSFNARPFITFLEALTGIEGLIPDPYFGGGGFHEDGLCPQDRSPLQPRGRLHHIEDQLSRQSGAGRPSRRPAAPVHRALLLHGPLGRGGREALHPVHARGSGLKAR